MLHSRLLKQSRYICARLIGTLLFLASLCVITSQPAFATDYRMVFLGNADETYSQATGINNLGQIVGVSSGSDGKQHPFIWSADAGMQVMQTDSGFVPQAISDSGIIAGHIDSSAAVWNSAIGLKTLGQRGGVATSVNDKGYVAGWAGHNVYPYSEKAYMWSSDGTEVGVCSASESIGWAYDINNHNQVVGTDSDGAFVWDAKDGPQHLGTLGGSWSSAYAINDEGMVAGLSDIDGDTTAVFTWTKDGGLSSAFTFYFYDKYYPKAINSAGTIVGSYSDSVFTWSARDGLSIIGSGYVSGINDAGQIAGWIDTSTGLKAVVWEPVPEPSSILALLCGIGGLGGLAVRRRTK